MRKGKVLKTQIDQLSGNIYRICLYEEGGFIAFNHFLIVDEKPTLIHMGHQKAFPVLYEQVSQLIDPAKLKYLCFSHLESDESGALNDWLSVALDAEICIGKICASSVKDLTERPIRVLKDNEKILLGKEALVLLETPHVPHNWDACLYYATEQKVLFGSDLGTQTGFKEIFTTVDPSDEIMALQKKIGYMSYGPHLRTVIDRLKALDVEILAVMHGSSLRKEQFKNFLNLLALENHKGL